MRTNYSIRFLSILLAMLVTSTAAFAQFGISVSFGPPALPVYEQPICPGDGYLWTPGYWAYDSDYGDYYWVPGTWVEAPEAGYLWTPGYWGWGGNGFVFNEGYWGPQVGFYGGINYGYGFFGDGFQGGRWQGGHFYYNRSVNNVNVATIHNVYNTTIINNTTVNRVSYNGGQGGITARPTAQEQAAAQQRHIPPVAVQVQHVQMARTNPQLRASVNNGKPAIAATAKPGQFGGEGAVPAKEAGAPYHPPANRAEAQPRANGPAQGPQNAQHLENENVPRSGNPAHAGELQPHQAPALSNTGNPKLDQKYQQQQSQLIAKQNQQHVQLQQKQEQEHQRLTQQNANDVRKQQVEQQHQQQTQQLEQRHTQQQEHLQQKQPAPSHKEENPR
jgi:WXXGXW repeat (2 copies)